MVERRLNDEGDPNEAGVPIPELQRLEAYPSPGFGSRLRNKIHRRSLVGQFVSLSWNVPRMILIEFVTMAFAIILPSDDHKGDRS